MVPLQINIMHHSIRLTPHDVKHLSVLQCHTLAAVDILTQYTVEPLYNGHHWGTT